MKAVLAWQSQRPLSHQHHIDPTIFAKDTERSIDEANAYLAELKKMGFLEAKLEIECPNCGDRKNVLESELSRPYECGMCLV